MSKHNESGRLARQQPRASRAHVTTERAQVFDNSGTDTDTDTMTTLLAERYIVCCESAPPDSVIDRIRVTTATMLAPTRSPVPGSLALAVRTGTGNLDELVEALGTRIAASRWDGCRGRATGGNDRLVIPHSATEANPDQSLYGQTLVFTGGLMSMTRSRSGVPLSIGQGEQQIIQI